MDLVAAGVWMLGALAVFAPLIASNQPLLWCDDAGWASPWLESLFDRNFYGSVDVCFNTLLLPGLPLALGAWAGSRRFPRLGSRLVGAAALVWGLVVLGLVVFPSSRTYVDWTELPHSFSVFPPVPWSARDGILSQNLESASVVHLLGTDNQGRDIFTRLLFGARVSLLIGLVAAALFATIGAVVGTVAGYFGGWVDLLTQAVIEVVMCVPALLLVLAAAAFIEQRSVFHAIGIIAAVSWTGPARLVRAEVLRLRALDFVAAARAAGFPQHVILLQEVLPNAIGPVFVSATFGVANAIMMESTLGFLGLGDPSSPSWGQMLSLGTAAGDWVQILAPGLAIFLTVALVNLAGEAVRDAHAAR